MYEFSRAMYRRISDEIDPTVCPGARARVLRSCEAAIERLATDPHYFARPERHLFREIRMYFPLSAQARVRRVVEHYVACAQRSFAQVEDPSFDAAGHRRVCQATTRDGAPCRREPVPESAYCPSHRRLVADAGTWRAPAAA